MLRSSLLQWTQAQWDDVNANFGTECNNGYDWFGIAIGMSVCGEGGKWQAGTPLVASLHITT